MTSKTIAALLFAGLLAGGGAASARADVASQAELCKTGLKPAMDRLKEAVEVARTLKAPSLEERKQCDDMDGQMTLLIMQAHIVRECAALQAELPPEQAASLGRTMKTFVDTRVKLDGARNAVCAPFRTN